MIKSDKKMRLKKFESSFASSFTVQGGVLRYKANKIGQLMPIRKPAFSGILENAG